MSVCKHFDDCGGCSLQHLLHDNYIKHKLAIAENVIQRLNLDNKILRPLQEIDKASRRRVDLKLQVNKGVIKIGFYQEKSHEVIDIGECPVTQDQIVQLIPNLKSIFTKLKKPANITAINISNVDNGLDMILSVRKKLSANEKEQLIGFAEDNNIIRLATELDDEIDKILVSKQPRIKFADTEIDLPIGAFLQATQKAQDIITNIIVENLEGSKNIADLYCGCGTYSFPLASLGKRVVGYEGTSDMVMAMYNAIKEDNISVSIRDLYKQPLKSHELKSFDSVVINPPRNGALPQIQEMSKSEIEKIIYVSCNPNTFERDAKQLIKSGYKLNSLTPIDQFLWSNHLELVGVFSK